MSENKKISTREATQVETAGMETAAALTGATISCTYSTTRERERQPSTLLISDFLPHERENALKLRDLKELFSKDSRTIRSLIQRERLYVPILSDNSSGYWVSDDEAEVEQFTRSMRHRARQIWATAAHVEKAAGLSTQASQPIDGQIDLWGR